MRNRARGVDPRRLETVTERISISHEETFPRDVSEPARLHDLVNRYAFPIRDFLTLAMDMLVNQATKYRFLTQEQVSVPLVIRSVVGAGGRFGAIHSQMPVSWLMGVPGLKIVAPFTYP